MIAPGMQVYVNHHKAAEVNLTDIGADDSPFAFLFMLPQSEIEKLLIAELEKHGVTVEHNMEVVAFSQDDDGVVATVKNKQGVAIDIHADYLIGADGSHSVIRNGLGLKFEGGAYPQNFMLADCSIDWPLDYAYGKIFLRGKALAVYLPIKGQNTGRIIAISADTKEDKNKSNDGTTAEPLELVEVTKALQAATGDIPIKLSNPIWVRALSYPSSWRQ